MSRQRQQPSAAALTAAALNHLSGTPPLPLGHPGQHQPPPPSEDDNSMETGAGGAGGTGVNMYSYRNQYGHWREQRTWILPVHQRSK